MNGHHKGYFYQGGYLRTSSSEYNLKDIEDRYTHLTNDAIQGRGTDYGKFETCNKLSFIDFEKYLESRSYPVSFYSDIYPKIKKLVRDTFL